MTTINILVTGQGVAAQENLDDVNRTNDVTWIFNPGSDILRVVFKEFGPLDVPGQPISERGPFTEPLKTVKGTATGTVRLDADDGFYFYEIHDNNGKLVWLNPISETKRFGGVEVHGPPPKS